MLTTPEPAGLLLDLTLKYSDLAAAVFYEHFAYIAYITKLSGFPAWYSLIFCDKPRNLEYNKFL